ncbi:MAG: hypothetical protein PWQ28_485 [Candidatus Woesearchaeota archaeon]|nr:hypothetical protein [Candidatus Woesearchaeota archaeon]
MVSNKKESMSRNAKKIYNILKKYPDHNELTKGIPRFPHEDSSLKSLVDILTITDENMIYSILKNTSFFPDEYDLLKKEIIEKNHKIREVYSIVFHIQTETDDKTDKNSLEAKKNKLYEDELYDMLNLYNKVLKYSTGNYRENIQPMKAAKEIELLNSTLDELNKQKDYKELDKGFLKSIDEYIVPEYKGFEDYYPAFLRTINEDITQIKEYEDSNEISKMFFETLKKYSGDDELIIATAVSRALKKGKDKDENKKTLEVLLNILNKESVLKARDSFGGLEWRNKLKQRFEEAEKNDLASYDVAHSLDNLFNNIDKYQKFDDHRKTNILKRYISRFKGVLKEMEGSKETETVKKLKPSDEALQKDHDRKLYVSYLADIIVNRSYVSKPNDLDSEIDSLTESALKYRGEKLEKFLKTMDKVSDFGYGVGVFSNTAMTKKGKDFDVYLDDVINVLEQLKGSVDNPILSEKEINDIIEGFKNKREKKTYLKAIEEAAKDDEGIVEKVAKAPIYGILGKKFEKEIYKKVKKKDFENIEYSFLPEAKIHKGLGDNVIPQAEEYIKPHIEKIIEFAKEFKNQRMRDSYMDAMKNIIRTRTTFFLESTIGWPEILRDYFFEYISKTDFSELNDAFKSFKKEGASEKQIVQAARSIDNIISNDGKLYTDFERKSSYRDALDYSIIPAMKHLKNYFVNPRELWNIDGIENLIEEYIKRGTKIYMTLGTNNYKGISGYVKHLLRKAEKMPSKHFISYLKNFEKIVEELPSAEELKDIDLKINSMIDNGEYNKINRYLKKTIRKIRRETYELLLH